MRNALRSSAFNTIVKAELNLMLRNCVAKEMLSLTDNKVSIVMLDGQAPQDTYETLYVNNVSVPVASLKMKWENLNETTHPWIYPQFNLILNDVRTLECTAATALLMRDLKTVLRPRGYILLQGPGCVEESELQDVNPSDLMRYEENVRIVKYGNYEVECEIEVGHETTLEDVTKLYTAGCGIVGEVRLHVADIARPMKYNPFLFDVYIPMYLDGSIKYNNEFYRRIEKDFSILVIKEPFVLPSLSEIDYNIPTVHLRLTPRPSTRPSISPCA